MSNATATVSGHVVRDGAGRLWVDVPRRSACQTCAKSKGCGMGVLGGLGGNGGVRVAVDAPGLVAGQRVSVTSASSGLLQAAFLAYGLPALGLVVGAVTMAVMNFGDGAQALGAALGLVLGALITRQAVARGHLAAMTLNEE